MAKQTATAETVETQGDTPDGPLIDSTTAAVKRLLQRGRERGYVTYDELNTALPQERVSTEQIEDTLAVISEMGINIIEAEEAEDGADGGTAASSLPTAPTTGNTARVSAAFLSFRALRCFWRARWRWIRGLVRPSVSMRDLWPIISATR